MRLLFIGESIVLAGAVEIALRRGHQIVGVFPTAAAEATSMARDGLPITQCESVENFCAAHQHDVLFSIVNGHILSAATLARPQIAAINYHNALLPKYAGLFATSWAIINGEPAHGITWHLMAPGIDTGNLLAQRKLVLTKGETTHSLNVRCSAAALDGLEEVFDSLERGEIGGRPQDPGARTYYGRHDTAPNGGEIDWNWSVEEILRLVRACDWGPTANTFGVATATIGDTSSKVLSAQREKGIGQPGTILSASDDAAVIACADGAVALQLARSEKPFRSGHSTSVTCDIASRQCSDELSQTDICSAMISLALAEPDAPAIESGERTITRGEISKRAYSIAQALHYSGLQAEGGVGILMPIGSDFVAAALGAMIAGGAYVPLDPSSPQKRHLVEIQEAGISHLLTNIVVSDSEFSKVTIIDVTSIVETKSTISFDAPKPDACAYRIFTSGTSGRPKAVEVSHAALGNLIAHYHAALPLNASDRMTMLAHPTFDASVADIWPVLSAGGVALVPPERILLDPTELISWLASSKATCAFVPTAIAERIFNLPGLGALPLKNLLTGGSALHRRPPAGLPFRLINTYGPTENTVDSLWADVLPGAGTPTIGRPIAGVTARIVDHSGGEKPPGEIGELMLTGKQIALGYRNQPALNDKRFPTNPIDGTRCYRTGDLARLNEDGEFEFFGRIDDQVQLRGIRVEPGEIEALLKAHPNVADAACLPVRSGNEVTGLAAFVVPAVFSADRKLLSDLLAYLRIRLPAAITPKTIEVRIKLPRTPAGKLDRNALMPPDVGQGLDAGADVESDPIRALWRAALPCGTDDTEDEDFWSAGGDSLSAIELLSDVERACGVRVSIGMFLSNPSLAGLRHEISVCRNPAVVRLRSGAGPTIVLWYGVSGDLEYYPKLVARLEGYDVIGVRSPALTNEAKLPETLEETVSLGLSELKAFGISEAPAMLGYSWGGLLAFEAARQLAENDTPPPFVGLVGTLPPFKKRGRLARLGRMVRWAPVSLGRILAGKQSTPGMRESVRRVARLFRADGNTPVAPDWAKQPLKGMHLRLGQNYRPPRDLNVVVSLFRETSMQHHVDPLGYISYNKPDLGWSTWTIMTPEVYWLQSDHTNIMKGDAATQLAGIIRSRLNSMNPAGRNGDPL